MDLSIIIVNYNVKYFLEQCLHAVLKATTNIHAEILVVDNHSTDGSREYLEPKFQTVRFFWQDNNEGFGKANNFALEKAVGKKVLFLNPDTIIPEDSLENCISFFDAHADCGALGVRMIDGSGNYLRESKRAFPSPSVSFLKLSGLAAVFPRSAFFSKYYLGSLPENETNVVDVLPGACFMAAKELLTSLAGFDEDFFMYGEDVDLSYRVNAAGYKNYYFPAVTIIHFKGESTQKKSDSYARHFYGAMKLFVRKHYSKKKLLPLLMEPAIICSKLMHQSVTIISNPVKRLVSLLPSGKNNETILVSTQPEFDGLVNLLKHAVPPLLLVGRVEPFLVQEQGFEQALRTKKVAKIIFCAGELSYSAMISAMQNLGKKYKYLFHHAGSSSVVGSDDKNGKGMVIAAPQHLQF